MDDLSYTRSIRNFNIWGKSKFLVAEIIISTLSAEYLGMIATNTPLLYISNVHHIRNVSIRLTERENNDNIFGL